MKFPLLISLTFCLAFASCNDAMDTTYSPSTYVNDIAAIRESDIVSADDIELLTKYITLSKLAGNNLEGKTYGEILESIKSIRQENTDQSDRANLSKEAARGRMSSYLSVSLSEKNFSKLDNKDHIVYTVTFQNLSSKKIKMIVGSISVNDLLDREIKNIQIVFDEQITANATLKRTYNFLYDHNNENDKRIRLKELVDLRPLWNPEKIIFEDGTIAE